jgi:hypothetical protein
MAGRRRTAARWSGLRVPKGGCSGGRGWPLGGPAARGGEGESEVGFQRGRNGSAGDAHRVGENGDEALAHPGDDSGTPVPGVVRW